MANYLELLESSATERQSIVCFGIDPDLSLMPPSTLPCEQRIVEFYSQIIDAALGESRSISALKPNYAFFAQYGFEGLRALKELIGRYSGKLPIILDAKRGDIGKSSEAYAREAFDFWGADAVTVSPYMGKDSVLPFVERCKAGKGAYVLCRTSNEGASDFQAIRTEDGRQLFLEVAAKIAKWHFPGLGAVVGATSTDDLEAALWVFYDSGKKVPLLLPGVGAQGASAKAAASCLKAIWKEALLLHRISSSSAIAYAYKKSGSSDFVGEALAKIRQMNDEIGKIG